MGESFDQGQRLVHARDRLLRIAERPENCGPAAQADRAGILPIKREVRPVPLRAICSGSEFQMLVGLFEVASPSMGDASGVMSLNQPRAVVPMTSEVEQSIAQLEPDVEFRAHGRVYGETKQDREKVGISWHDVAQMARS